MIEGRKGRGRPVHLLQEARAVVVRIGRGRIGLDRKADQPFGVLDLAGLVADDAECVQRLEMPGLGGENLAVDARSVRKPSGAAQLHGILQSRIAHQGPGGDIGWRWAVKVPRRAC